jgi:small subunit ribosomal protein S8
MVTDPIADFIVRLRNATAAGKGVAVTPYSKLRLALAEILAREGYIGEIEKRGKKTKRFLEISLNPQKGKVQINGVRRLSKPGRRLYTKAAEIRPVKYGHGTLVISTPKGLLTDKEARKENVGGEPLFEIW